MFVVLLLHPPEVSFAGIATSIVFSRSSSKRAPKSNAVMTAWHKIWTGLPNVGRRCSTKRVEYAYEQTCVGSLLKNLAVDQLMYDIQYYNLLIRPQELPHALLHDMILVFRRAV